PQPVETDVFSAVTGGSTAQFLDSETTDTTPSVSWATPTDGEVASGEVTLQIAANDEEDAAEALTVEHRLGDASWKTATYNAETGYHEDTWDTTGVDGGDYRLEARVTDSAGNDATASATVTVDNETASSPPKIEAVEVNRTNTNDWSRFDVDWTVTDADGDLDMVVTTLLSQGTVVAADSTRVSGEQDSYTHRLRDRGQVDELRITVNDVENQVDSLSEPL
ncbi:Ig-like domain-containing protein, partial [Haloarcula rubripromontorii]|uniref:Ig-like domain-containing protein n=1 Tax=Haloarcula rubripromontorii TaxID=1705562 RepID=UPI00345B5EE9